jgi:hypothetical protein
VTIIGVIIVLTVIASVYVHMRPHSPIEAYPDQGITVRMAAEDKRAKEGMSLLDWKLLRKTNGTVRAGARFHDTLRPYNGQMVNVVGFMTPIDQFDDVAHFMLLPMPVYCYFCEAPPMRDILLVELEKGKKADLVNEPVLIAGHLELRGKAGDPFFYSVVNAKWDAAVEGMALTPKEILEPHKLELTDRSGELLGKREVAMIPGQG